MSRKEIIYLSGAQILLIMILVSNALVIGFFMRWHSYKIFRQEDADLSAFTIAQRKEHSVKESIRTKEGVLSWNETAYAKKYEWSRTDDSVNDEKSTSTIDLIK